MKSAILKSPLPYIALLIAHTIWGMNYVVAKITLQEFPIMTLGFLRYAFAFILIAPFLFLIARQERKIKTSDLPLLITAGLLMVTINIALFFEGLVRTSAINASTLALTAPILSVLGAWIIFREKIYFVNLLGVLLGLTGSLVIIGIPLLFVDGLSPTNLVGNLLIVASSISVVFGAFLSKRLLKTYLPVVITAGFFLIGAVTFFIPAVLEYINNPGWVNEVTVRGILGLFYIVFLSSVSSYFLLIWGLKRMSVPQATLMQYIEPAIAATLALPLLGERISYSFIVGTCLIVLGVYWGTLGKVEHHHYHHKAHRI